MNLREKNVGLFNLGGRCDRWREDANRT